MTGQQKQTAIQKRAHNQKALAPFALSHLGPRLPLRFPRDPTLPPSPKHRYRSDYRYLGAERLDDPQYWETHSSFDIALLATLQFCQKYGTNEIENGCIFANQRSAML